MSPASTRACLALFAPLLALTATALASMPRLESRNMPSSCQFVYQVESDLSVRGHAPPGEKAKPTALAYRLLNHYDGTLTQAALAPLGAIQGADGSPEWKAELTVVSMSQNPKALYRIARFWLSDAEGARVSPVWESEFARQFGEACQPGGREDTPFRERIVTELPEP